MSRKFSNILSLTTIAVVLSLTALKAQATLLVSNTAVHQVVNYDPVTHQFSEAYTPEEEYQSSILSYDNSGNLIGTLVSPGKIGVGAGIAIGPDGNIYAADTANNDVLRFNGKTGAFIDTFIASNSGSLFRPEDVVFGPNNIAYVSSLFGGGVLSYDATTGEFLKTIATTDPNTNLPLAAAGLDIGPDNNLYISSVFNGNAILRYNTITGILDTFISPQDAQPIPGGSAFSPDGKYFFDGFYDLLPTSDGVTANIKRYDATTGALSGINGTDYFVSPCAPGVSNTDPACIAINGGLKKSSRLLFGPDGNLYASSLGTNSILRYSSETGAFLSEFISANGGLAEPAGLIFTKDLPESVPEPSSLLGLLGFGAYLGTSLVNQLKQKQQKLASLD
jgi:hypothetical protein